MDPEFLPYFQFVQTAAERDVESFISHHFPTWNPINLASDSLSISARPARSNPNQNNPQAPSAIAPCRETSTTHSSGWSVATSWPLSALETRKSSPAEAFRKGRRPGGSQENRWLAPCAGSDLGASTGERYGIPFVMTLSAEDAMCLQNVEHM